MANMILTINDYTNYGNRLQNYAMHQLLSSFGDTSTAFVELNIDGPVTRLKRGAKSLIQAIKSQIVRGDSLLEERRINKIKAFSKINIPDNDFIINDYQGLINKSGKSIDRIVVGSDQIWNPLWFSARGLELRLGSFADTAVPLISYAASFGVASVGDEVKPKYKTYLPRFDALSVREFQGAKIIKKLTDLDAQVVLDPTLMMDSNDWRSITDHFVGNDDEYILTYFLGRPSDAQETCIQNYAKEHGWRIRRMLDFRDPETYVAGIQDFVELFCKAKYVFTDSYHACCFSILFGKQFTVYNRENTNNHTNMNSRMETLFELFELDSVVRDNGQAPKIDYSKVNELLDLNRDKSRNWINSAMKISK